MNRSFIGSRRRVASLSVADRLAAMFGHQVTPQPDPFVMTYFFKPRSKARASLPMLSPDVLERDPVQVRLGDQVGAMAVAGGARLELATDALGGSALLVWSPSPRRLLLVDLADLEPAD